MDYTRTVVAELHKKYAIVLDEGGFLQRIKRKQDMKVGDVIYYTPEDIYVETNQVINFRPSQLIVPVLITAALFFLIIGLNHFLPGLQDVPVSAAVSIGTEEGIQLEIDQDNYVTKVRDAKGVEITDSTLVGVHFDDLLPLISSQIINSKEKDIVIASTITDSSFQVDLVQSLRDQPGTHNIVFLESDIDTYQESIDKRVSLSTYALEENDIHLWNSQEGNNLTPQEKQSILGSAATYYEVGPNYQEIRQELKKQLDLISESMHRIIVPRQKELESVDPPARPSNHSDDNYFDNNDREDDDGEDDDDWDDDDWDDDDWDDDDWDDDDWDDDDE